MSVPRARIIAQRIRLLKSGLRQALVGRRRNNLPWRKTHNPYHILVSEIMLQQTQATRVVPKYEAFLKRFPTVLALAASPLADVLRAWVGLGYNRRAKMLWELAQRGPIPRSYAELIALPGVGEYTAKAVRVFAYNEPEVMIETNIRTVFIHHFFPKKKKVSDKEIVPYMELFLNNKDPRTIYADLMDYGSFLKQTVENPSRRSKHHTRQKPFTGSDREIRGAILRTISAGPKTLTSLYILPFAKERIKDQLAALVYEGLVTRLNHRLTLP